MTATSASPPVANQLVVVNPATGERIGVASILDAAAVADLARQGRAAQSAWNAMGFNGRALVLRRMQGWLSDHAVVIARSFPNKDLHFYPTDERISPKLLKAVQLLYGTTGKFAGLRPRALRTARGQER
ncbi:aldehyde dehydrogenase family protein [Kribbella antibiotica]|uniref:Aldehyde dehydrogenase family protein n=1 Tax=Kribbella antibiotica TaxID=190195 RepID=A0A4V2YQE4_9ACTN|nr:aldehyde dehydrogenase family protein [Kribbella antibiotica]TDD61657.1 aldehyde dehydrogenase family protein [Kribbella antibiotica]